MNSLIKTLFQILMFENFIYASELSCFGDPFPTLDTSTQIYDNIYKAARHGDERAVSFFIDQKNIKIDVKLLILITVRSGNLNRFLRLIRNTSLNFDGILNNCYFINDLLFEAAKSGNVNIIKFLIYNKQSDPNATNARGTRPIHIAALFGNFELVYYLISTHNAFFLVNDDFKFSILKLAIRSGNLNLVRYLHEFHEINLNQTDENGDTLLHIVAPYRHVNIALYLVRKGLEINPTNNSGYTVLHRAIRSGYLRMVHFFVSRGAKPTIEILNFLQQQQIGNIEKYKIGQCLERALDTPK